MSWSKTAAEKLSRGETVVVNPRGNSMRPKIKSGAEVTIEPVEIDDVSKGDIVLCRVNGRLYLHLVKAKQAGRLLIGNNHGRINGWTRKVYGKVIEINN